MDLDFVQLCDNPEIIRTTKSEDGVISLWYDAEATQIRRPTELVNTIKQKSCGRISLSLLYMGFGFVMIHEESAIPRRSNFTLESAVKYLAEDLIKNAKEMCDT